MKRNLLSVSALLDMTEEDPDKVVTEGTRGAGAGYWPMGMGAPPTPGKCDWGIDPSPGREEIISCLQFAMQV